MCLIGFSWKQHPLYKLVLVANRDEFYQRPTQALHFWETYPGLLAGKDLEGGGTWLGIHQRGRFAALTNYRDPAHILAQAPSRGDLPLQFLVGASSPAQYLASLLPKAQAYNGYNLLVGDRESLFYYSNYTTNYQMLPPGLYGLSNHLLDTDWFKVRRLKAKLHELLQDPDPDDTALLALMQDPSLPAGEADIQQTGLSLAQEKMLAPMFIQSPHYGTHSTTVLKIDYDHNIQLREKVYSNAYRAEQLHSFSLAATLG
ncbi:MAG: NRDE family protein [Microscillaceae bacterium]|nr:NRDE family protein [Microscillaceae bacterium]